MHLDPDAVAGLAIADIIAFIRFSVAQQIEQQRSGLPPDAGAVDSGGGQGGPLL